MTRKIFRIITVSVFILAALGAGALVLFPGSWGGKKDRDPREPRIIIPRAVMPGPDGAESAAERMSRDTELSVKAPLQEGEVLAAVLNDDFDGDLMEEQLVAYRNLFEIESPVYLGYIDYDEASRTYKRVWSAPTAATRPGTLTLYTQDLIGDRGLCVLLGGMNGLGEHTLTVFRKTLPPSPGAGGAGDAPLFTRIAEFRIEGNITVREAERTQAYRMGMANDKSFTIAAYGRDYDSANIMDQVEITYAFNELNGLYEQKSVSRIPGSQIEQRRLRELLGSTHAFEEFISGLWYYVSPEGTLDSRQYIYFDPGSSELIFYGDEAQQVFSWQNSSATRYGIYIASQNISVSTLRRAIDIELESLDSIKVRVFEDVRLKIKVDAPWNGSYRKAGPPGRLPPGAGAGKAAHISAAYDGSIGKISFGADGSYELSAGGTLKQGNYSFFSLNGREVLELRPAAAPEGRETYLVEAPPEENSGAAPRKRLTLRRVRLGARGLQELHEGAISLTLSER
jgi:hypothetical protein